MAGPTRALLALAVALAVPIGSAAGPAPAEAASFKKCGKLGGGKLADRIRAKSLRCDDADTRVAIWIETRGRSGPGTHEVHGYRCRSRRIARGVYGVTCSDNSGPAVVKFRYLKKNL